MKAFKTIILLGCLLLTSNSFGQTDTSEYYYVITKDKIGNEDKPRRINIQEINRVNNDDVLYITTDEKESKKVSSRGYNVVKIKKEKVNMTTSLRRAEINTNKAINRNIYNTNIKKE